MTEKLLRKLKIPRTLLGLQAGYLLPAVLIIGLGISTVSVMALQTIAHNSSSLTNQYHGSVAKEAAQAGIAAAIACINSNSGTRVWGTGGTPSQETLTPKGCSATPTGTNDFIDDNDEYRSTYRVLPVYDLNEVASRRTTSIITAKGIVQIKGPGGTVVSTIEHTARTQVETNIPTVTSPDKKNVVQISTGENTACGVTADAAINDHWIYCWGSNTNWQLGYGRNVRDNRSTVPLPVYRSPTIQPQITGTCVEWNIFGQCTRRNPETTPQQPVGVLVNKNAVKVSVGRDHTCAIARDGTDVATQRAYCWGRNDHGQLGTGNTTDSLIPLAVSVASPSALQAGGAAKTVTDITAGNGFTCALTSDGLVSCWGLNGRGQLGNDSTTNSSIPVAVSQSTTVIPAKPRPCTGTSWGTCVRWSALSAAPEVPASALVGKQVESLARLKGTAATMCVVTTEKKAVCWGQNYAGQLGDGHPVSPDGGGSGSSRINNNNACAQATTNALNQAGGRQNIDFRDVPRPVAVQTSLLFDEITITAADWTQNIPLGARTIYHRTAYVSAVTSSSSTNPNRSYYWGGSVASEEDVSCRQNGSGGGTSDYALATVNLDYDFNGTSVPTGPLNQTGQGSPAGSAPLTLSSGNAFNGLFCAKASNSGGQINIYCDPHGTTAREGQLGNGTVCTTACATGPVQVSTTQGTDTSSFHGSDLTAGMAQTISSIDTGISGYTCALASPTTGLSTVLCWGKNDAGQLGINSTSHRFAPTYVYTADTNGLGRTPGSGGSPVPAASGTAAFNSSNGTIPSPTAGRSF